MKSEEVRGGVQPASPALLVHNPSAERTLTRKLGNLLRGGAVTRAPQKHASLTVRLMRSIVSLVLAVVVVAFLAAYVLAQRWTAEPFLGLLLEPTLVLSPLQSVGWAQLPFDPPLDQPCRLVAVDGQPVERYADVATVLSEHTVGDNVRVLLARPDGNRLEEQITLAPFPLRDSFLLFIVPYLVGLAYLGIGMWVYWIRGWDQAVQVFASLCAVVALMIGGAFDLSTTHRLAVLWCVAVPFAAAIVMHLAMVFPPEPGLGQRILVLRLPPYLLATFLAFRSVFSVYDVNRPWAYINQWRNSSLFVVVGILFLLCVLIYRLLRSPSPLVRQQSRIILLGVTLAFLPVAPWLLLDVLGQPAPFLIPFYAPLFVLFPLSIAYAILRHRLLDVDRLFSRGLAYGGLAFLIVAACFVFVNGLNQFLTVEAGDPFLLSLSVLVLVLFFNPMWNWAQRLVDRVFFREPVDYRTTLHDFGRELTQTLDLDAVLAKVGKRLERKLYPTCQWVCLYDKDRACYVGRSMDGGQQAPFPATFMPDGALASWLRNHQEPLYLPAEGELPAELADERGPMGALGAIVYVPLRTRERMSGWLALGPKRSDQPYRSDDLVFLSALADQSSLAVENARLFASVRRNLATFTEMKRQMDDVFSSIASGVITTDAQGRVTIFNCAAEAILGVPADEMVGRPCHQVLRFLGDDLQHLVKLTRHSEIPVMVYEVQLELPTRGPVWLRMNLSPLKDSHGVTTGVTIVVDDLTERRQLEARMRRTRGTFERYMAPAVVEQLLSNPESVRLGGVRQEVTSFYADIRGFTAFSEKTSPEFQIKVLNKHLTLAAAAILGQGGTMDRFVGDSAMAIFNAPVPQADHTLRAVRAALATQQAVREYHAQVDERERLHFGIGVTVGQAVVGNIGSAVVQSFTAIGDCANFSSRLSSLAGPGKILISAEAYERVKEHVEARFIGHVQVKGHSQPDPAYEVVGLKSEDQQE